MGKYVSQGMAYVRMLEHRTQRRAEAARIHAALQSYDIATNRSRVGGV